MVGHNRKGAFDRRKGWNVCAQLFFSYNIKVLSLFEGTFVPSSKRMCARLSPEFRAEEGERSRNLDVETLFFRSSLAALPKILEPKKSV